MAVWFWEQEAVHVVKRKYCIVNYSNSTERKEYGKEFRQRDSKQKGKGF